MNSKVKRYSWHVDAGCMVEETDGTYVESDDYAALEAECERLRAGKQLLIGDLERRDATVEGLRAELADAKSARDAYGQNALDMQAQRDALAAELAAIKGKEPVGWRDPAYNWSSCSAATKKEYPKRTHSFTEPLYTLPAAPEGGEV